MLHLQNRPKKSMTVLTVFSKLCTSFTKTNYSYEIFQSISLIHLVVPYDVDSFQAQLSFQKISIKKLNLGSFFSHTVLSWLIKHSLFIFLTSKSKGIQSFTTYSFQRKGKHDLNTFPNHSKFCNASLSVKTPTPTTFLL